MNENLVIVVVVCLFFYLYEAFFLKHLFHPCTKNWHRIILRPWVSSFNYHCLCLKAAERERNSLILLSVFWKDRFCINWAYFPLKTQYLLFLFGVLLCSKRYLWYTIVEPRQLSGLSLDVITDYPLNLWFNYSISYRAVLSKGTLTLLHMIIRKQLLGVDLLSSKSVGLGEIFMFFTSYFSSACHRIVSSSQNENNNNNKTLMQLLQLLKNK